jgi:hypothetical protein
MNAKTRVTIIFTVCALVLVTVSTALATGSYQVTWWTVDSGGGSSQSTDGQYVLNGTAGQPEAGSASGSGYSFNGGFWHAMSTTIQEFLIHMPLVNR